MIREKLNFYPPTELQQPCSSWKICLKPQEDQKKKKLTSCVYQKIWQHEKKHSGPDTDQQCLDMFQLGKLQFGRQLVLDDRDKKQDKWTSSGREEK